jgi:hypothetical protein
MDNTTVKANEHRDTGPLYDRWPASLPIVSFCLADGGFLCVTCANGGNGSLASIADGTEPQWRVIGAQCNDYPTTCDHCNRIIAPLSSD